MLTTLYEPMSDQDQAQTITAFDLSELDEEMHPTWRSRILGLLRGLREIVLPERDESDQSSAR